MADGCLEVPARLQNLN